MANDLLVAFRSLRNDPRFATISVVTLALCIGANAAVFSIADAVLFRPLPYAEPDRLYLLRTLNRESGRYSPVVPNAYVEAVGETSSAQITLRGTLVNVAEPDADGARWVGTIAVAPTFFDVLGVRPFRGRLFDTADSREPGRVAVLTHETWRQRFGSDDEIIGRPVPIGGRLREVIGVLPPGFVFPGESLVFPYAQPGRPAYEYLTVGPASSLTPRTIAIDPLVRLNPGTTLARAQAQLESIGRSIEAPGARAGFLPVLVDVRSVLFPVGQPIMRLLLAGSGFLLFLGCGNLAHLLLTRVHARACELALRAALGAPRLRLVRPLVLEAVMIGIGAAGAALVMTTLTFDSLRRQVPAIAYGSAVVGVDWRVGLFALGLGVLSGGVIAAVPAWRLGGAAVQAPIAHRGRNGAVRYRAIGRSAIAVQVALAMVLATAALVSVRNLVTVLRLETGFSPRDVIAIDALPDGAPMSLKGFYLTAVEALAAHRDVASAGACEALPLGNGVPADRIEIDAGDPVPVVQILPGYLEAVGVPLMTGRALTLTDARNNSRAAVVSESAARLLFDRTDPLGRALKTAGRRSLEVVGVVGDVRMNLNGEMTPLVYSVPSDQATPRLTMLARMRGRSLSAPLDLRRVVSDLARDTPVTTRWWSDSIDAMAEFRTPRFHTLMLGAFATLAVLLTALGVFGVVSFLVSGTRHELGVRLALGARPAAIVRLVLRQTLAPTGVGISVGFVVSWWVGHLAEARLMGFEADDSTVLIGAVTVIAAALLSAYLPARKASRLDPTTVLRAE